MKRFIRRSAFFAVLLTGLVSCAEQHKSLQELQKSTPQITLDPQLQLLSTNRFIIVDQAGQPMTNATILIGYEPGNPFEGNVLNTDASGIAEVPADWKAALPITVQAPGYVASTIPTVMPGDVQVNMTKQEGRAELEVAGTPQGFGRLVTDGKVDFALLIPALSRQNLLGFDVASIISPKTDTIDIIGNEVEIPSNISLPRQTENYIFPITLDKPNYRVYFRDQGEYLVSATHGQFPLRRVVDDIRGGKSIFEVVNHFDFIQGGQQVVNVTGNVGGINLPINTTRFTGTVNVSAPNFAAGNVMLSLALADQNGLLMPSDLKRLNPGQRMALKLHPSATTNVLSILLEEATNAVGKMGEALSPVFAFSKSMRTAEPEPKATQDFNKLSFAFLGTSGAVAPQFLPLVAKPVVNGNLITLEMPAPLAGVNPLATYLVFSEVETIGKIERRTRLWEVWVKSWVPQVELPQITFTRQPGMKYRWEVIFMGGPGNIINDLTQGQTVDLNTVTHVTRNATDI